MTGYSEYKDSKVRWLGMIPSHWDVMRVKYYCQQITSGATPSTNNAGFWDGDIPWIPSGCCQDCDIIEAPKYITEEGLKNSSTQIIPSETPVMAMTGATCSRVGYLTINACTNQSVMSYIVNKNKCFPRYLFYTLWGAREYVLTHQTGGAQAGINGRDCRNLLVPLIPMNEQKAIASFLDQECLKIDNLIKKQKLRISLLQKLKLSVVTYAITKGLDHNIEFVDSGIDWIGKIPSNWSLWKTSHLFTGIGSGTTPTSSDASNYDDEGYYWLQTGDLNDGHICNTSKKITDKAVNEKNLRFYPINSLVIAMYGATIGKLGILDIEASTNQACCVLPPSKRILPKFAFYHFMAAKQDLINQSAGGGQPNISQDIIRRHKIALPPTIEEQQAIVDNISEKTIKYDAALKEANKLVDLLMEFKQSLITDVVTGKRKVC